MAYTSINLIQGQTIRGSLQCDIRSVTSFAKIKFVVSAIYNHNHL